MKIALGVLAVVPLLAGCGSKPATGVTASQSPAVSPNSGLRFSLSYNRHVFGASWTQPAEGYLDVPGIGRVSGTWRVCLLFHKAPRVQGSLAVWAVRPQTAQPTPTLAQFTRQFVAGLPSRTHVIAPPHAATLGGLPAFGYLFRVGHSMRLGYVVVRDGYVYRIDLDAPTSAWRAASPKLKAVAQTLKLTQ